MQAICGNAGSRQTPCQLFREKNVAQLRPSISAERAVTLFELKIVEVDRAASMGIRRCVDYPRWSAADQSLAQFVCEYEIRHVIRCKRPFQSILGEFAGVEDRARIVEQHIESRFLLRDVSPNLFGFCDAG